MTTAVPIKVGMSYTKSGTAASQGMPLLSLKLPEDVTQPSVSNGVVCPPWHGKNVALALG